MKPEDWISVRKREPDIGDFVLAQGKGGAYHVALVSCDFGDRFDFWMPIVPPAKPDPFETWWETIRQGRMAKVTGVLSWLCKDEAKQVWDAALKSKEQGE